MDTRTTSQATANDVRAGLEEIKTHMPETYRQIQAKANEIGRVAYAHVRGSLAGQPNRFYAIERGRVIGTPFDIPEVRDEIAALIVEWGCTFLIMWAPPGQAAGGEHAAH